MWKIKMFKLKENGEIEKTLSKKEVLALAREYAEFSGLDFLKTDYDKLVAYLREFYTNYFIPLGKKKTNIGFGIIEETEEIMYVDDELDFNYGVVFIINDGMFKGTTAYGDVVIDKIINGVNQEKELIL